MANRPVTAQTDPGEGREPSQRPPKPWRTEGLPPEDGATEPPPPRPRWWRVLGYLLVGYLVVFGLLSVQDSIGGPTHIPYTDFTAQVEQRNVAEVVSRGDSIQGELREPRPVPGEDESAEDAATYEQFTTERPTFAQDDLLAALKDSGAVVSAEPLTQERGVLLNLLISLAPILLLFGFWYWLFKRSQKALGAGAGGMFGGLGGGDKRKPVDPESVRTTFADVAGIDEVKGRDQRDRRLSARSGQVPQARRTRPQGCVVVRVARYGEDAAGACDRRRGRRAVLLGQWFGVHRDDRRRGRQPGP